MAFIRASQGGGSGNAVLGTFTTGSYATPTTVEIGFKPKKLIVYGSVIGYTVFDVLDPNNGIDWGKYTISASAYYTILASDYITFTDTGFIFRVPSLGDLNNLSCYYMAE